MNFPKKLENFQKKIILVVNIEPSKLPQTFGSINNESGDIFIIVLDLNGIEIDACFVVPIPGLPK